MADKNVDKLFDKYKDKNVDAILVEGMEKLCVDMKVDPSDISMLVLAHYLGADHMCCFTRGQFRRLKSLAIKTAFDIKKKLPELQEDALRSEAMFKSLYDFTFTFGLEKEKGEKVLPIETAMALWRLIFSQPQQSSLHLERWLVFLQRGKIRGVNRDVWREYLNFTRSIGADLSGHDPLLAWPTLLDEFVEMELSGKQNAAAE